MDILSLLSPQDSPVRETPSPPVKSSTRKPRRTKSSSLAQTMSSSSLPHTSLPPPTLPHSAVLQAQQSMPSPPEISPGSIVRVSSTGTPTTDSTRSARQSSTSGMDTLADLASMQHHQQTARTNAGGLRNAEVYDSQLSAATILPNLHLPRTNSGSRGSLDLTMTDVSAQTPPPRIYTATSLSESELRTVSHLVSYLAENPYAYESHVQLVRLLHQGFVCHVSSASNSKSQSDPHTYDLLQDLRQATEAMDARFAMGEDLWIDRLRDQKSLSSTLEDDIAVVEACEKAVREETGSTTLWSIYGDWIISLFTMAYAPEQQIGRGNRESIESQSWSEEDKLVAQEVFGRQAVLDVWKRGAEETKYRINDSHIIWNHYTELLLQDLAKSPSPQTIAAMKAHFLTRLRTPHATWDETFQSFSTFISTYDSAAYEEIMVTTNQQCADAKEKCGLREVLEMKLQRALDAADKESEWRVYNEYLDWELSQSRKKKAFSFELVNALYQRANLRFPTDTSLWEDYLMFLVDEVDTHKLPDTVLLPVLERATRHCPWSGTLWSQYLQAAERDDQPFTDIGQIKHKATSTGLLDAGGMEEVLKVHTAWCGFLRRRAFQSDSTDEELDVAEVGIRSAIEDMETLGRRKYDNEYKGDPHYRLERIYIKYLSESRNWQGARDTWKSLITRHGDSYEFWLRYYYWEMMTWGKVAHDENGMTKTVPTEATKILRQAVRRTTMDWPEKIMETFLHHCEDHESVAQLQSAVVQTRKAMKIVTKRREKEALEAAQGAQAAREQQNHPETVPQPDASLTNGKRKREDIDDLAEEGTTKKSRPDVAQEQATQTGEQFGSTSSLLKRDRENATVIVKNLPFTTTETRVRQYFRDCGRINSLKLLQEDDGASTTATIEFDSKEDVLTAQTKDMKTFDGNAIEVQVGTGSTLFVTNFPPTADEAYIRDIFSKYGEIVDIRFPSLKYNTHRRFCYVQFKSSSQAQAATDLNGKSLGGKLKLLVKISDPGHKQDRSGALYEGREVYVSNLDWSATEDELGQIFSKYGKVERVRIPTNVAGKSKGMAFVVFSDKDEATAALDMNLTKFKSRLLNVSLSTANPAKRQATTVITSTSRSSKSASPQPDTRAASVATNGASPPANSISISSNLKPSRQEIESRTLALLNIPDTVNDARIRAIVEPYGPLTKIILRPDHQGAIVEFQDVASAGKAALGVDGYEISPGRKIGVGTVGEMLGQKAEVRSDRIGGGGGGRGVGGGGGGKKQKDKEKEKNDEDAKALQVTAVVKRPAQPGARRGGKGGLGFKRGGLGFSASKGTKTDALAGSSAVEEGTTEMEVEVNGTRPPREEGESTKPKSNADFKAMFLKA